MWMLFWVVDYVLYALSIPQSIFGWWISGMSWDTVWVGCRWLTLVAARQTARWMDIVWIIHGLGCGIGQTLMGCYLLYLVLRKAVLILQSNSLRMIDRWYSRYEKTVVFLFCGFYADIMIIIYYQGTNFDWIFVQTMSLFKFKIKLNFNTKTKME